MSPSELDRRALLFARTRGHTPAAERLVAAFSRTGEHAVCWIALGVTGALADAERREGWLRGVRVVLSSYALNQTLKFLVRRRRPELDGLPPLTRTVTALSFPSAHATTSFAAARGYHGLVPTGVLYGAATGFALSRPYLGVHYPSDVLAGALLGTLTARIWPR